MESMSKMHTHYITNAKTELKFAYSDLNDEQFQQEALYDAKHNDKSSEFNNDEFDESDEIDEFDEQDKNDEQDESNDSNENNERGGNFRHLSIGEWVDFNDPKLAELLNIQVNVVIDKPPPEHSPTDFNMDEILDRTLIQK